LGKRPPARKAVARTGAKPARRKSGSAPVQDDPIAEDNPIQYGAASLHDLFQQSVRAMLDRTDLDEEQKQGALLAASCPCCGTGSMSFTAKLKRRR
jgi:hypothetical protein